ncbi:thioesterase II family protein [Streptomyces sp. WMMB 322]|uniref:thioesterase II family protein n=1 Tax=Streptomyces sp. WMMB 322 TaxID=1286821 RepID=UPI0006E412B3|nr:alpha/beta fold hydrolase [Streptomyces sp. WMMB 322]
MNRESAGVFVFPGAGSFGSELTLVLEELKPSAWLLRYPGRFGRDFGRAATSFEEVVESCVSQVRRVQRARPVLVGHSYGAYVAHATAGELENLGTEVSALVVAGATAPAQLTVPESATRDQSDTAAYLDSIDPGLISDASSEWQEIIIETVMQDLRLLKEFAASKYPKVRCPIFAARGDGDPLTSTTGIGEWVDVTVGGFTQRVFPGGHSDLLNSPEFASWLREVRSG